MAIASFEEAIDLFPPEWYQPHENLGDAYRYQTLVSDSTQRPELLLAALAEYQRALSYSQNVRSVEARAIAQRRIEVSLATAQLLSGDDEFVSKSRNRIRQIEEGWNPATEPDATTLYNLGAWYAIALRQEKGQRGTVTDNRHELCQRALTYLAYAFVRADQRFWDYSELDPDLGSLGPLVRPLKVAVARAFAQRPDLGDADATEVATVATSAVASVIRLSEGAKH